MSNITHLLENALAVIQTGMKFGCDYGEAFNEEMDAPYNQEMLKNVSTTKEELFEMAEHVALYWIEKR
nr:MAG TPA: hypothetical protein [Caudoviricetes sp.]